MVVFLTMEECRPVKFERICQHNISNSTNLLAQMFVRPCIIFQNQYTLSTYNNGQYALSTYKNAQAPTYCSSNITVISKTAVVTAGVNTIRGGGNTMNMHSLLTILCNSTLSIHIYALSKTVYFHRNIRLLLNVMWPFPL